ncbi:MAG: glycosyltransferase [Chthoniobacterales bacterium]
MRRIVFHAPSLGGGGAERVVVLIANELASRGHEVILFTWNAAGPNALLVSAQVQLVDLRLPIRGGGFGKLATLGGLWRSAKFLRAARPDAVYSAPEFANLLIAVALVMAGSSARFFPSFHAAASLPSERLGARLAVLMSRLVAYRATKAVAVSRGVGRDIAARGISLTKIAVIGNPVALPTSSEQISLDHVSALADMGNGPVIVSAGRLVAVKDHRTLLAAFAELRRHRPARLVIFGEGPLRAALIAYAAELDIQGSVLFPGYVNDPACCFAVADVFVLSSTSEGFGNVLVEAMAAGVPVVSTDAPHGPREILADGRFGLLVAVGDALALAAAIEATLDHPLSADCLKARAADYDIRTVGGLYEALLT